MMFKARILVPKGTKRSYKPPTFHFFLVLLNLLLFFTCLLWPLPCIRICGAPLQRAVFLFTEPSDRNTFVGGKCTLPSALVCVCLSIICLNLVACLQVSFLAGLMQRRFWCTVFRRRGSSQTRTAVRSTSRTDTCRIHWSQTAVTAQHRWKCLPY